MKDVKYKRYDKPLAVVLGALTIMFIILAFTNEGFFNWAFTRHQNQLSWYIRPLFLIPFCLFACKRSWAGILGTMFLLFTSMFWFPKPDAVNEQVSAFLQMEKDYLTGDWGTKKFLISLLIPVSLTALSVAFWKRSLWLGISVLIFIAVAKILWSVAFGGTSGSSVIVPAIIGLAICIVLIYIGFKKLEKKKKE